MKTIKDWLKEYLTKEEYKKAKKYKSELWKDETFSFRMAVVLAFDWYITDEGAGYWEEICNREEIIVKQKDSIVDEVRKDLLNRSQTGIKKYNTTLDRKDLSLLEWHQHHYEELLDAALYTKRIIKELKNNEL